VQVEILLRAAARPLLYDFKTCDLFGNIFAAVFPVKPPVHSSIRFPPLIDQDRFNSGCTSFPVKSGLRGERLFVESVSENRHGLFQAGALFTDLGEVGGGGEQEPLELMLDSELQLVDRLLDEQLIDRASDVDRG